MRFLLFALAFLPTAASGTQALVISQDNKLHYQPITVGRDFGQVIEVLSGLRAGDKVVNTPNDNLHEGQAVRPAPAAPPAQGG